MRIKTQMAYKAEDEKADRSRPEQKEFRNQARWTRDEVKMLHDNFESFVHEHEINPANINSFLFGKDHQSRAKRKSLGFTQSLAKGLNNKTGVAAVKKIKQERLAVHHGKFSEDELKQLSRLQRKYGNKWMEIGLLMGRDHSVLAAKHYAVSSVKAEKQKFGLWTEKEIKAFNKAIASFEIDQNRKRHQRTNISWETVARAVGTRSFEQCKAYYTSTFAVEKSEGRFRIGRWDDREVNKLKYAIAYSDIEWKDCTLTAYCYDCVKISRFIGTRTPRQCAVQVRRLLKSKKKNDIKQIISNCSFKEQKSYDWGQSQNCKLIKAVKEGSDESSIDWFAVSELFSGKYPIDFLRNKWHLLKVSVSNYQICHFQEVIDNLCVKFDVS